MMKCNMIRLTC